MSIVNSLKERRSYYNISKKLPVDENKVIELVKEATEFTPDAFNMKSARVVVALGEQQDKLWDGIFDAFGGKVPIEKIDSFKAGAGTILYFYDESIVKGLQEKFPAYANNFPIWANQANGMLQSNIWVGLRELGIGASIQHYNPVIDEFVKKLFDVPESYILVAQMPFGGIVEQPAEKAKENISDRVVIKK
ncbi:nitroreductase family protein [Parvimonas sp. D2]|uniref:nitroreductase family protein n=1 Tax=unclassified Parvimonas TaxID=1151464 RepID=UPI002B4881B9|nr:MULTISPECIES: nitroreductase family protein [unclassified Parvimonas]MEB3012285.1 nitroreductase family protein [Parvimonas sp. D2]MEB3087770.1 nitroreductase family protein [Parvimonas sp. D4]